MTKIISVDPGKSGALCVMNLKGQVEDLFVVPTKEYETSTKLPVAKRTKNKQYKTKTKVDLCALENKLKDLKFKYKSFIVIEEVSAMPGQGVTSMFSFGETFGTLKGILYKYSKNEDLTLVRPQKWKKHFKVSADKDTVIEVCKRLYPQVSLKATSRSRNDHDGMAEAVLIGRYFLDCELKKNGII